MLDLKKPVQTRSGQSVRILTTDRQGEYPVVGLISYASGEERVETWALDGRNYKLGLPDSMDLVNTPPPKRVVYLNDYPDRVPVLHVDRSRADAMAGPDRSARIRVEFEDGQFDE